jgi:hypothetical protein
VTGGKALSVFLLRIRALGGEALRFIGVHRRASAAINTKSRLR